jgi:hypothetical protein
MGGNVPVTCMEDRKGGYKVLMGKPDGKRTLLRLRHRLKDDIKMEFQEVGLGGMDWRARAQDRARWRMLLNAVMNLRVP